MKEDIELNWYVIELEQFGEPTVFLGKYLAESYEEAINKVRWEWSYDFPLAKWGRDLRIKVVNREA